MERSQSWIIPTVMSPEKGGPVYNQLRANFAYARRMVIRHPFRWLLDNWDYDRAIMLNIPEITLEKRRKQWTYYIDGGYWGGIMDKVFQDFMIYLLGLLRRRLRRGELGGECLFLLRRLHLLCRERL